MELHTEVEREAEGHLICLPIIVEFAYHKAMRGSRDSLGGKRGAGPPLEPDTPAEVEITSVYDSETRHEVTLTKGEENRILAECWEMVDGIAEDYEEDR